MAIDYSDRQIPGRVTPNRPKKRSIAWILFLSIIALFFSYLLGLATGWFLFGQQPKQVTIAKPVPTAPVQTTLPQPNPPALQTTPPPSGGEGQAPPPMPLTFYDTLAKGEKGVMGSGINPAPQKRSDGGKSPATPPAAAASSADPSSSRTGQSSPPEAPKPKGETSKRDAPPRPKEVSDPPTPASPPAEGRLKPVVPTRQETKGYTVQIASTADRGEAESLRKRLETRGIAAYVAPFDKQGKSWYRVRAGRSLTESAAKTLAASIGGGAIVVPE